MAMVDPPPPQRPKIRCSLLPLFIAATLVLRFTSPAGGQTPSERIQELAASASGFQILGEIQTGMLRTGQTQGMMVPMYEGSDYMVVGFCGDGCRNMDLTVLDPTGLEIASDHLPDAEPIVTLSPTTTGRFGIQARMVECGPGTCAFAVGILGSSPERGVAPGEDMTSRLSQFASDLNALGFTEIGVPRRGSLATEEAARLPLVVEGGVEYRVVGVCDIDCYDMDLILRDPDQTEVASDFLEDAVPVLAFIPQVGGIYDLEVGMVYCELEPCAFQIATYVKSDSPGSGGEPFGGELLFFQTYDGELEEGDQVVDQVLADSYEVQARAGQRIVVDLRTHPFRALVRIVDPNGRVEESEAASSETSHSHLEIMAPADGTYTIHATSSSPEARGSYFLQVAVVG